MNKQILNMKKTTLSRIIVMVLVAWMGLGGAMAADVIDAKDATIKWAFDKSADNASAAEISVDGAISTSSFSLGSVFQRTAKRTLKTESDRKDKQCPRRCIIRSIQHRAEERSHLHTEERSLQIAEMRYQRRYARRGGPMRREERRTREGFRPGAQQRVGVEARHHFTHRRERQG